MIRCGLLGRKLGHSYSPRIHAQLGDYSYELFEKEPGAADVFLRSSSYHGLNITIPYKKLAASRADELSPLAARLGSVNTLLRRPDGTLYGDNTDYTGFRVLLAQSGFDPRGRKALVLGSGGASVTVQAVLADAGAEVIVISRNGEDHYGNLTRHADASLIVNATPVGMYPGNGEAPLSLDYFPSLECVIDLIYNPARTALLMEAETRGLIAIGGLSMLVAQAVESARIWGLTEKNEADVPALTALLAAEMLNIVLIGMPGCGKSTVSRQLGKLLGRPVRDTDAAVRRAAGCSVTQLFEQEGEAGFRARETEALRRLGAFSGIILATGGGAVTREENYPLLHQNGTIVLLRRDLSELSRRGRPISQSRSLESIYNERLPLYERFADIAVDVSGTPAETAGDILSALNIRGIFHEDPDHQRPEP